MKKKKKKKTKSLIIVASVLGVVILLIGAFFLGRISKNEKSFESKSNLPLDNSNKKEGKFNYVAKEKNNVYHAFKNIAEDVDRQDWRVIYVSEIHPEIKRLLKEGKLRANKMFIIRYGKPDKDEKNLYLTFNENNQELEIKES